MPGRRIRGRAGTVLFAVALLSAACNAPGVSDEHATLPLEEDTIRLGRGSARVDVVLRAAPPGALGLDTVRVRIGDVVRFIAGDALLHAVVFDGQSLAPDGRAFLENTGQLRGPPLVETGASWIVSFEDAPAGEYPFANLSQDRRGLVIVAGEPE